MNIILREVTKENYLEAIKLKVTLEQNNFVASNIFSIAQSKFYPPNPLHGECLKTQSLLTKPQFGK
ncbi:MAG: hypothetical protein M3R36_16955 [Bacteroidota bacterium]|nr:hypothetical protein [Bacteroidota bacterium]